MKQYSFRWNSDPLAAGVTVADSLIALTIERNGILNLRSITCMCHRVNNLGVVQQLGSVRFRLFTLGGSSRLDEKLISDNPATEWQVNSDTVYFNATPDNSQFFIEGLSLLDASSMRLTLDSFNWGVAALDDVIIVDFMLGYE